MDTFLKLIDYFVKLVDRRHESKRRYFERYAKPAFEAAQIVFEDYLKLLHSIKRKVETGKDIEEIIRYLEDGRIKYLPLRMKLRAAIFPKLLEASESRYSFDTDAARPTPRWLNTEGLSLFERGIAGVMRGGLAPFEDGYFFLDHYSEMARELSGGGRHTVLDLLYIMSDSSIEDRRGNVIERVNDQIKAIMLAWEDVVTGYAEIERQVLNK
jgi:hypothetical protein